MIKVLHLASWYPNRTGIQDGDLIQRHIHAISKYSPAHLIHVVKDEKMKRSVEVHASTTGNVHETIVYYNSVKTGLNLLDKILSFRTYLKVFKEQIRNHIAKNGKPDLIHVHVAMRAGVLALWIKKKYGIPFILTEHWSGYFLSDPDNLFARGRSFQYYTKQIVRQASWITAVSENLRSRLHELFSTQHSSVVYNVVDTTLFSYRAATPATFEFVHISNMHPIKNVQGILNVLTKLKEHRQDWQCTMVGYIETRYVQLSQQMGLDEFLHWTGSVNHEKVPEILGHANALLMFSNHENLSCVVCEALCSGLPVLATRVGGLPEIVNDTNGKLCEAGDEEQLLNNILQMMDSYSQFNQPKIATNAALKFNEEAIAQQFLNIYSKVKSQ